MRIERFEDVQGWQKGRELAQMVYAATGRGAFARDSALREQWFAGNSREAAGRRPVAADQRLRTDDCRPGTDD